jgi:hypothetical protein
MGFLAPLFLIGLLSVALPIWLHRLQTQSSQRQPFSSAMLLEPAEQRVYVRRKIKYRLLLALRIALLACLAIAFAKPFVANPPVIAMATEHGTHLIAVDVSASMGRDGVFADGLSVAQAAIDSVPGDAFKQVLAAGGDITVVTAPSVENNVHWKAVEALEPGGQRLDFGQIMAVADRLAEHLPAPVSLHLVSDFQQSAMPSRFADLGTRHLSALVPHHVDANAVTNRGIEFIRSGLPTALTEGEDRFIEVGFVAAAGETVQLQLNDDIVGQKTISEGALSALKFEGIAAVDGDNRVEARLLGGDGYAADDARFHVFEQMPPQSIPVLTTDKEGLGFTYLANALASGGDFAAEAMMLGEFDPRVLSRYRLLLIGDVGVIDATLEAALTEWIAGGGHVLGFAGPRTATLERLPVSGLGVLPASTRAKQQAFASPGRVDGNHPLLARTEGWHSVKFGQVLPVEPGGDDEILVALDDGMPLVIETPLGQGKMMMVTAALQDRSNDFPIRTVFVGFIVEAARYLTGASSLSRAFVAGDWLALTPSTGGAGQVLDPDGKPLLSLEGTTRVREVRLNHPGIYTVYTANKEYSIAVNTDPRESQFAVVDPQVLADWVELTGANAMNPVGSSAGAAAPRNPEAPNILELWPWVLMLLVVLVIGESLLGNAYFAPAAARE